MQLRAQPLKIQDSIRTTVILQYFETRSNYWDRTIGITGWCIVGYTYIYYSIMFIEKAWFLITWIRHLLMEYFIIFFIHRRNIREHILHVTRH